jgi:hypothetical protein
LSIKSACVCSWLLMITFSDNYISEYYKISKLFLFFFIPVWWNYAYPTRCELLPLKMFRRILSIIQSILNITFIYRNWYFRLSHWIMKRIFFKRMRIFILSLIKTNTFFLYLLKNPKLGKFIILSFEGRLRFGKIHFLLFFFIKQFTIGFSLIFYLTINKES